MAKIDLGITSPEPAAKDSGKRYVKVPEKDLFEFPFPTIRINLLEFPPGKHYVDNGLADYIEDRIDAKQKADVRTMQRNPDITAQNAMNRFGVGRSSGSYIKNPDSAMPE
jgi:hypothetical protein